MSDAAPSTPPVTSPELASGEVRWRALTTHARVLLLLARRPDARQREIAAHLGLTEGFVTRVIDELVRDGYLDRHRQGRRNRYAVRRDRPLPNEPIPLTVADLEALAS